MAKLISEKLSRGLINSNLQFELRATTRSMFYQSRKFSTRMDENSSVQRELDPSEMSVSAYSTRINADSDTHDDFKPTSKLEGTGISIEEIVQKDIKENPVMIYMKGLPDAPRCGFSALAVKVMRQYGVPIGARDILADMKIKEGVKQYTKWPTFPQIFIKGEFVGGSDIVLTMHQKGELKDLLEGINT